MNNPNPFADPPSVNPYAAEPIPSNATSQLNDLGRGLIGHVLTVSIMQIVMAVLELVMALFLIGYGVILPQVLNQANQANHSEKLSASAALGLTIGLTAFGCLILASAILRIVSGINGLQLRRRRLMLVSLIFGMTSIFTCYCSLFSIALGVYGIVVLFDPAVMRAFEEVANGASPESVRMGRSSVSNPPSSI
jgi:hypothetical protein